MRIGLINSSFASPGRVPNLPGVEGMPDEDQREPTRREWTGYWSLIVQQSQYAFNEKAAQFLLVPLGGWTAARGWC